MSADVPSYMQVKKEKPYGSIKKQKGLRSRQIVAETEGAQAARVQRLDQLKAHASKPDELRAFFEEDAFEQLSRSSTMLATLPYARRGGQAPGRNGLRWDDLGYGGWIAECARLQKEVRSLQFRPTKPLKKDIKKPSGGVRRLSIPEVQVRLQQRVLLDAAQAAFDSRFQTNCWGSRPKRGRRHAVAWVREHLRRRPGCFAVTADVKNAFDTVPIGRLRELLKSWFVDIRLVEWALALTSVTKKRGLGQGGPLSPFLLNVLLHDVLDRRFPSVFGPTAMHRYVDDLLILGDTEEDVRETLEAVRKRLGDVGMVLKNPEACPRPVTERTEWLGYQFAVEDANVELQLDEGAWNALEDELRQASQEEGTIRQARAIVHGWIDEFAAVASDGESIDQFTRLLNTIDGCGFDGEFSEAKLLGQWHRARKRFAKLCEEKAERWNVAEI